MTETVSLKDYAGANPAGPRRCWVCNLPEREEIDEGIRNGTTNGVIRRWLINVRGYIETDATCDKLRRHRENHVAR